MVTRIHFWRALCKYQCKLCFPVSPYLQLCIVPKCLLDTYNMCFHNSINVTVHSFLSQRALLLWGATGGGGLICGLPGAFLSAFLYARTSVDAHGEYVRFMNRFSSSNSHCALKTGQSDFLGCCQMVLLFPLVYYSASWVATSPPGGQTFWTTVSLDASSVTLSSMDCSKILCVSV